MARKLIKFYADWCGPCKVYAKTWDKVVDATPDGIEFISINVDKDPDGLALEHKVRSIPHTVLIEEDGSITTRTGQLSEKELKELISL